RRLSSRSIVRPSGCVVNWRLPLPRRCKRESAMSKMRCATARLIADKHEDIVSDTAKSTGQGLVWLNGSTQSARTAGNTAEWCWWSYELDRIGMRAWPAYCTVSYRAANVGRGLLDVQPQ
ncbi:questionable protein, partial [Neurospora crassa]